jgi:hypothetical protein
MRIGGRRGSCCLSAAEGTPGHGEDGPGASAAVSRGSGSGRAAGGRRRTRPRIPSLPRARRGRRELCARGLAGQALNLAGARGPQGTATALSCGLLLARQRLHRHGTASDIKGSAREEARSRSTLPALMLLTRGVTRAPRSAPGVARHVKARKSRPARRGAPARSRAAGVPADGRATGRDPGLSGCSARPWRHFRANWPPHGRRRHSTRQQQSRQLSGYVRNSAFSDDRRHPGPGPAALRARAAGPPAEPPARGPVPPAISAPSTSCADRPPG